MNILNVLLIAFCIFFTFYNWYECNNYEEWSFRWWYSISCSALNAVIVVLLSQSYFES